MRMRANQSIPPRYRGSIIIQRSADSHWPSALGYVTEPSYNYWALLFFIMFTISTKSATFTLLS